MPPPPPPPPPAAGTGLQTYEFVPADRSLLVMPLFHVHGLMAGLLAPLAAGAGVILPAAGRFAASSFWADAVQHGMTFYTAVPTMHQILLSRAEQDYPAGSPPPLRAIRSCSSSLAPSTLHKVEAAFKAPVLEVRWVGGRVGGRLGRRRGAAVGMRVACPEASVLLGGWPEDAALP